jgi:two-component system, OmpR family, response regulator
MLDRCHEHDRLMTYGIRAEGVTMPCHRLVISVAYDPHWEAERLESATANHGTGVLGPAERMRLLLVEDDVGLASALRHGLTQGGHVVDVVHDGLDGLELSESGLHDAVILDVMLPGLDGLEVAQRMRTLRIHTPVIMLTAKTTLSDRLAGFDAGADDYLTKPFAFQELLARLRAITRRGGSPIEEERLVVGDLVMDTRAHQVMRARKVIDLRPKEYALLEYLMRNQGQALGRMMILENVWEYGFESFANVVDTTILRLRKAVDEGFDKELIQTVRGVGYRIKA